MAARARLGLPHHLARRGLRLTGPRRAVLHVLAEGRVPMTVPDIHARLAPGRANIASVYRTVQLLTRLNLVRSIDTTRRSRRYELSEPFTGHHHHLICQACGRIDDLDGCVLTDEVLTTLTRSVRHSRQFQVSDHEIRLFGICRTCAP
jgi:Fur family ferric uptake transcriptional regulator